MWWYRRLGRQPHCHSTHNPCCVRRFRRHKNAFLFTQNFIQLFFDCLRRFGMVFPHIFSYATLLSAFKEHNIFYKCLKNRWKMQNKMWKKQRILLLTSSILAVAEFFYAFNLTHRCFWGSLYVVVVCTAYGWQHLQLCLTHVTAGTKQRPIGFCHTGTIESFEIQREFLSVFRDSIVGIYRHIKQYWIWNQNKTKIEQNKTKTKQNKYWTTICSCKST